MSKTTYILKKIWYAVIIALLEFWLFILIPFFNILFCVIIGIAYKFFLSPFVEIGYRQAFALMGILIITKYFWKYEVNDL